MNARRRVAGICLLVTLGVSASPQQALNAQTPVVGVELSARAATILGSVVDGNDTPIAAARLRLRDLTTGRILATTRGEQTGEFRFNGVPAGSYIVEFVDENGNVRGVSQTLVVASAETRTTIVRLSGRRPWYAGFFNNAAMAVVSSAAGLGVTAVGNGLQPASGRF
jgi:carboxypeptidase family protein